MAENAKPRDVQAGWTIFRDSGYQADLEDINRLLGDHGFGRISPRTYNHYRKLRRYGYERYVPINQLDVETLRDPVWDTPLRHRYLARSTYTAVSMIFVHADIFILHGEIISISDLDAVASVSHAQVESMQESGFSLEGAHGLVLIGDDITARSVVVEGLQQGDDPHLTLVLLQFPEIISADRLVRLLPLSMSSLALTFQIEDSRYLLNTVRVLNGLVAAMESVRIACDESLRQLGLDDQYFLPPPEVTALERQNPLHMVLAAPEVTIGLFVWFVGRLVQYRKQWHAGTEVATRSDINVATAQLIRQRTRLVGQQVGVLREVREQQAALAEQVRDQLRGSILQRLTPEDVKGIADVIIREVSDSVERYGFGGGERHPEVDTARLETLIERQLLPSMEKLLDPPVDEVEYESDVEGPDVEFEGASSEDDEASPSIDEGEQHQSPD